MQPQIIADFETQLSTAIAIGATSFSISSGLDDDGVAAPTGTYYFTVDNGASNKEYLTGTLTGTSVTVVKSVSRQGVETTGAVRAHRVGASVIMSDFATYKKYIDAAVLAGALNASTTVNGITRVSVAPVSAAIPISVGDNDPRMPTTSGAQFISATTGMISMYAGTAAPTGFLACDGTAVSRATYAALFAVISTSYGVGDGATTFNVPDGRGRTFIGAGTGTKVATFASRSGNVITVTGLTSAANNEFQTGQAVTYVTSGTVITGLTSSTVYYVVRISDTTFSLATTLANAQGATVIALSSDGSGTQTFTQTLTARTRGDTGGEENHAMITAELAPHTHNVPGSGGTSSGEQYSKTSSKSPIAYPDATNSTGGGNPMNIMSPFFVGTWIIKT